MDKQLRIFEQEITWRNIRISILYGDVWYGCDRFNIKHLVVQTIEPEDAPLPITSTGFRSHHVERASVDEAGGPVAYVTAWLEEEAQSDEWRAKEAASRQLDLF